MDDADYLVDRFIIDRDPRVAMIGHQTHEFANVDGGFCSDHVHAGLHDLSYPGSVEAQHGAGRFTVRRRQGGQGGYAATEIGGPAPMIEPIRAAVRRAMAQYRMDAHTTVTEHRSSPGAIGEGWFVRLTVAPGSGPMHAH